MKAKKTIKIDRLKEIVNGVLLNTCDEMRDNRQAATHVLETVLHETGNYNGFMYLDKDQMLESKYGHSVGIRIDKSDYSEKFTGTDESRRRYA